jgi:hypothetical protein
MPSAARLIALPLLALAVVPAVGTEPVQVIYPAEDRPAADALVQPSQDAYSGSLRKVLGELARFHHVNVIIDEVALTHAGVSIDDRTDLDAAGHDLAWVLDRLLTPLDLAYVIEDGSLKITTQEAAAGMPLVRAYDVRPLLDAQTSAEQIATAVSQLMKALPTKAPPYRDVSDLIIPLPGAPPVRPSTKPPVASQVVAFKSRVVVIGSPADHRRAAEALHMLTQVAD